MDSTIVDKLYENKHQDIIERRVDILRLLRDGQSLSEISSNLFISSATVKRDVLFLKESFDAKNITELVVKAIVLEIINLENI